MPSHWGVTPSASIAAAVRVRGEPSVARECIAVLRGDELSADFGFVLAGPASIPVLGGRDGGPGGYWPRVWALRGLLYAWDDGATPAVIECLVDGSWRVREMSAKVIAKRGLGDAPNDVARVSSDPVPRVRAAAERALVTLVERSA